MAQMQPEVIRELIQTYNRRLQKLKLRKAQLGTSADVSLETEIEDIEAELEKLQAELELTAGAGELPDLTPDDVYEKSERTTPGIGQAGPVVPDKVGRDRPAWLWFGLGIVTLAVVAGVIILWFQLPSAVPAPLTTVESDEPGPGPPITPSHWLGQELRIDRSVAVSSQKFEKGWIFGGWQKEQTIAIYDDGTGEGFMAIITEAEIDTSNREANVAACPPEAIDPDRGPWWGFGVFWCRYPQIRQRLIRPVDTGQTENVDVTVFSNGYAFSLEKYGSFEINKDASWKRVE